MAGYGAHVERAGARIAEGVNDNDPVPECFKFPFDQRPEFIPIESVLLGSICPNGSRIPATVSDIQNSPHTNGPSVKPA